MYRSIESLDSELPRLTNAFPIMGYRGRSACKHLLLTEIANCGCLLPVVVDRTPVVSTACTTQVGQDAECDKF